MGKIIIEAKDLVKTYQNGKNRLIVLDNINIQIREKSIISIVGESGAGKSTLLRLLYRTYTLTSGEINFRLSSGEWVDIGKLTDPEVVALRGREIGYVSQFLRAQPRRSGPAVQWSRARWRRGQLPQSSVATLVDLRVDPREFRR